MLPITSAENLVAIASTVIFTSILSIVAYTLSVAIYRFTLHPLAKYPGPFLDKVTDLHALFHAWRGDRHLESLRCHEKYGDIYRNGPNSLSFNTNTALEDIYGHKSNCWKGEFYRWLPAKRNVYSIHSEIDKERHARKRRVISYAFSDKALKGMEEYILNQIRIFCTQVGSSDEPLDMAVVCDYLTGDILGDLCFGQSFGMQEMPNNRFVPDLIQESGKKLLLTCTMPVLTKWKLENVLFRGVTEKRVVFAKYCMNLAAQRTKTTTDRKDFFYYLLNAKDPVTGDCFTMPELWAESSLLLVAGTDTSSTCISGTFFYLTHNPGALEKVKQEVRTTFQDVEEIRPGPALNSCTYLKACIDETLRLSPPIGGFLPREVLRGGATIDGHHISAGTTVGCCAYAIHHNSNYFPSPFSYQPERWLASSKIVNPDDSASEDIVTRESIELAQSAFCAFSIGPRGCIGRSMAYMEIMTAMARMLWLFDMENAGWLGEGLPDSVEWGRNRKGEYQIEDVFVSRKYGPLVKFVKRVM